MLGKINIIMLVIFIFHMWEQVLAQISLQLLIVTILRIFFQSWYRFNLLKSFFTVLVYTLVTYSLENQFPFFFAIHFGYTSNNSYYLFQMLLENTHIYIYMHIFILKYREMDYNIWGEMWAHTPHKEHYVKIKWVTCL